jgi:hypothetical protein
MIVFDLQCRTGGHRFEGWFGSSDDYARQQERGLVSCPECASSDIIKAPMAPNIERKGNQLSAPAAASHPPEGAPSPAPAASPMTMPMAKGAMPSEAVKMMQALAVMQAKALEKSRWVGDSFVAATREMHYGEREVEPIHGQATIKEARDLLEEGIEVSPLPFPVAPPGEAN